MTGTSGRQKHMGNMICEGASRPEEIDNTAGVNVVDLNDRFKTSYYLTPHSDIVALMVLEHQTGMLNRLARAGMDTRMALHYEREINKALDRPADERSDSTRSRIRSVGEPVVQYMLFRDETRLTDRIKGTSSFASDFANRGPRDSKGRSLRDLDLHTRLFRYPCSYLIYSRAFDSLPSRSEGIYLSTSLGNPERPGDRRRTTQSSPRLIARRSLRFSEKRSRTCRIAGNRHRRLVSCADYRLGNKKGILYGHSSEHWRDGRITRAALLWPARDGTGRHSA